MIHLILVSVLFLFIQLFRNDSVIFNFIYITIYIITPQVWTLVYLWWPNMNKIFFGPFFAALICICVVQGAPSREKRNYGCFGYFFSFACPESSTTESPSRVTSTTTQTTIPGDAMKFCCNWRKNLQMGWKIAALRVFLSLGHISRGHLLNFEVMFTVL